MKKHESDSRKRSLSKGPEKYYPCWLEYVGSIQELAGLIKKSKIKFDFIYGIPRGGLIPAVILSHELNIPLLSELIPFYYDNKKVLMVDDIADNGKTLKSYKESMKPKWSDGRKAKFIKTAVIYKHKNSTFKPDFFVSENENWIVFPYEKD